MMDSSNGNAHPTDNGDHLETPAAAEMNQNLEAAGALVNNPMGDQDQETMDVTVMDTCSSSPDASEAEETSASSPQIRGTTEDNNPINYDSNTDEPMAELEPGETYHPPSPVDASSGNLIVSDPTSMDIVAEILKTHTARAMGLQDPKNKDPILRAMLEGTKCADSPTSYRSTLSLPSTSHGSTSSLPSTSHGSTLSLPSTSHGNTLSLPSTSHGSTLSLPSTSHGSTSSVPSTSRGSTSLTVRVSAPKGMLEGKHVQKVSATCGDVIDNVREDVARFLKNEKMKPFVPTLLSPLIDKGLYSKVFCVDDLPYFIYNPDSGEIQMVPNCNPSNITLREETPTALQRQNPTLANLLSRPPTLAVNDPVTAAILGSPYPRPPRQFFENLNARLAEFTAKLLQKLRMSLLRKAYKIICLYSPDLAKEWRKMDKKCLRKMKDEDLLAKRRTTLKIVHIFLEYLQPQLAAVWDFFNPAEDFLDKNDLKIDPSTYQIPHQPVRIIVYRVTEANNPPDPDLSSDEVGPIPDIEDPPAESDEDVDEGPDMGTYEDVDEDMESDDDVDMNMPVEPSQLDQLGISAEARQVLDEYEIRQRAAVEAQPAPPRVEPLEQTQLTVPPPTESHKKIKQKAAVGAQPAPSVEEGAIAGPSSVPPPTESRGLSAEVRSFLNVFGDDFQHEILHRAALVDPPAPPRVEPLEQAQLTVPPPTEGHKEIIQRSALEDPPAPSVEEGAVAGPSSVPPPTESRGLSDEARQVLNEFMNHIPHRRNPYQRSIFYRRSNRGPGMELLSQVAPPLFQEDEVQQPVVQEPVAPLPTTIAARPPPTSSLSRPLRIQIPAPPRAAAVIPNTTDEADTAAATSTEYSLQVAGPSTSRGIPTLAQSAAIAAARDVPTSARGGNNPPAPVPATSGNQPSNPAPQGQRQGNFGHRPMQHVPAAPSPQQPNPAPQGQYSGATDSRHFDHYTSTTTSRNRGPRTRRPEDVDRAREPSATDSEIGQNEPEQVTEMEISDTESDQQGSSISTGRAVRHPQYGVIEAHLVEAAEPEPSGFHHQAEPTEPGPSGYYHLAVPAQPGPSGFYHQAEQAEPGPSGLQPQQQTDDLGSDESLQEEAAARSSSPESGRYNLEDNFFQSLGNQYVVIPITDEVMAPAPPPPKKEGKSPRRRRRR